MKHGFAVLSSVALVFMIPALVSLGDEVNFNPSTYNPGVGEPITFEVYRPEWGTEALHYEWDFNGDGVYETSTTDPLVSHAFDVAGLAAVTLKAVDAGGRTATRSKELLVGESPFFAVREIFSEKGGSAFVRITLVVRKTVSAPGLEEMIPSEWQMEILDAGGAYTKLVGHTLQALWMEEVEQGEMRTLAFRLYPTYGVGTPTMSGVASGYAEGRVTGLVCGDLNILR